MAAKIQEVKDSLDKSLKDENKPWASIFAMLEEKTGVDRLYHFLGLVASTGIYLIFGYGAQLVCNVIGFAYPAYTSMKALESPTREDDTKWLTYWVVFATFSLVEFFADLVVGWFPLYWLAKCFFLIWLMMPTEYNGSLILYSKVIRPYFLKYQENIDETLHHLRDNLKDAATKVVKSD